jgi:uncharacterized membrane protein
MSWIFVNASFNNHHAITPAIIGSSMAITLLVLADNSLIAATVSKYGITVAVTTIQSINAQPGALYPESSPDKEKL